MDLIQKNIDRVFEIPFLIAVALLTVLLGPWVFNIGILGLCALALFRPVYALPLLFFSGILKNADIFEAIPVDLTLYSFLLFALFIFSKGLYRTRFIFGEANFLLLMMLIVSIGSAMMSEIPLSYHLASGYQYAFIYIPLVLVIINLNWSPTLFDDLIIAFERTLVLIVFLWIGMSFYWPVNNHVQYQKNSPTETVFHLSGFGEDYAAYGLLVSLLLMFFAVNIVFQKAKGGMAVVLLIFSFILLFKLPSKGILLGTVISVGLLLAFGKSRKKFLGILLFTLLILAVLIIYNSHVDLGPSARLYSSTETIQYRLNSIIIAFMHWSSSPFFGTGIDSVAYFNGHPGRHSHNIFLESIFEFGVIGSMPLVLFILVVLWQAIKLLKIKIKNGMASYVWIILMFVQLFIFSNTSGNLGGIRQFWIISALIIVCVRVETKAYANQE